MVIGVKGFDLPGRPSTPNPCRVPARGSIAREMNADPSHDAGSLSLTPAPGVVIVTYRLKDRNGRPCMTHVDGGAATVTTATTTTTATATATIIATTTTTRTTATTKKHEKQRPSR